MEVAIVKVAVIAGAWLFACATALGETIGAPTMFVGFLTAVIFSITLSVF